MIKTVPDGNDATRTHLIRATCRCECKSHGSCEHDFSGPVVYTKNSGSVTCARCGMDAMSHDVRVL
jgi:hypothetical protein